MHQKQNNILTIVSVSKTSDIARYIYVYSYIASYITVGTIRPA